MRLPLLHILSICMVLGVAPWFGCDISSSATDREQQRLEARETERRNRNLATLDRLDTVTRQAFASKYKGKIVPGVGCDVCPQICEIADLRPIDASDFRRQYQVAAKTMMQSSDRREVRLAADERWRLVCIARGTESMRKAMMDLLDAREDPIVRLRVAVDLMKEGIAKVEPRRTVEQLAKVDDEAGFMSRVMIESWNESGWPGH